MRATNLDGSLREIEECWIRVGDGSEIFMRTLPDISDNKDAVYTDGTGQGRSSPMKSFSHSNPRVISWTVHLIVCKEEDKQYILATMRELQSAVYPTNNEPYAPPPICTLHCGSLLEYKDGETELCAIMRSCNVKFPTDVVWDDETLIPYKLDIDLQFEVVYDSNNLPYSNNIFVL